MVNIPIGKLTALNTIHTEGNQNEQWTHTDLTPLVSSIMKIKTQLNVILIIIIIWEKTSKHLVIPRNIKDVEK